MQTQQQQSSVMNNNQFINPNMLKIRLDTSDIIQNLRQFLSGKTTVAKQDDNGNVTFVDVTSGDAICSDKGTQHLVNYVQGIINPAVVQGNYTQEQYFNHVDRIHMAVSRQILANYHDWKMKHEDLELVNDFIMNLVEPFLSRLVDNKERDSYANTLRSVENNTLSTKRSYNPFKRD